MLRHILKKILFSISMTGIILSYSPIFAMTDEELVYGQVSQFIGEPEASEITTEILGASYLYNVDPVLVTAVFTTESHFDQQAESPAGAVGIAQLMPETAAYLGVNPYNEEDNIYGGVAYLSEMLTRYQDWDNPALYAAAAYNAGPGAVDAAGGIPNYEETIQYVYTVEAEKEAILARLLSDGTSVEIESSVSVPDNSIPSEKEKQRPIQDAKPVKKVIQPPTIRVWPTTASEERDDQTTNNSIGIFRKQDK